MIVVDIPMPEKCEDCAMHYFLTSGDYEGMMMCCAMEAKHKALAFREPAEDPTAMYLVDQFAEERPEDCPIIKEIELC